ncbi:lactoylglutathione lyase [Enterococcus sp. PF1-24]|uniref:VOC family protein n=1 Tax=unclassified Enterococcus TaxID=2608891 RepID=UPI002474E572|nr:MULTISPECIES: VOC family protein [unclassified Enterococcus]MDH6364045.1 lactoylglutathione lyase [Enterococcus sp. PFB1-1]MDH6401146.1 lactoylglutathione lyase [Enterococcus sp. PF1-24]
MKIEHLALSVNDLEGMKKFYQKYFNASVSEKYHNQKTGFSSYFLSFDSGSRLELTNKKHLSNRVADSFGYAHLAMAVGDEAAVDQMAEQFVADGFPLLNGPRRTGDGYYEAVIQDPEGNLIEITTE